MRSVVLILFFTLVPIFLHAQELSGTWVMAYVKAKQPVYMMIQNNGELELDESAAPDSAITYTAGLMSLSMISKDSAVSYSWEGEEFWSVQRTNSEFRFNGQIDTLYGGFNKQNVLVLKSTIDDIPTEYVFHALKFKKNNEPLEIQNTTWDISGGKSYLAGQRFIFQADSALTSTHQQQSKPGEYYIHPLKNDYAIEFVVNTPSTYMGIIYLTDIRKNRLTGVFFSNEDSEEEPKRMAISLKRSK